MLRKTKMEQATGAKAEGDIEAERSAENEIAVVYELRDRNMKMVEAWQELFDEFEDEVKISYGDIFKDAPAADAIVSPANSFGFMDGGIDMAYSLHFGWQMQERLQEVIREEKNGELLVGDAIIIPTFETGKYDDSKDWTKYNQGREIKYLISAPTMRVPMEVSHTVNAYLAFRAVILAVKKHNRQPGAEPIRTVLCPGLGTAVGRMPYKRCAFQMLKAFETFVKGFHNQRLNPDDLYDMYLDEEQMKEYGYCTLETVIEDTLPESSNSMPELPTPPTDDPSDSAENKKTENTNTDSGSSTTKADDNNAAD